ncbi:hypothetical protein CFC21_074525 [Triticum aestivum]|uniref:Kinetochore protein NDC80 n=2 Tax=Triticum aestivum TaxID=4565 RepID=A0A3B6LWU5_WHEAT|nr:kinetochore protein NDC80 homolog [Triticum aestivum]KAF7068798.1 hypothetical protein CFC21_074525 [Triticum aestivum]
MRRGRGGGGGGRHPKAPSSSAAVDRTPMTDQPLYPRNLDHAFSRRDSDAFSVCSSMGTAPSHAAPITSLSDRASQAAALRAVNAYLAPAAIHLRPPLPPAKDIVAAFHHLADRLRYPLKPAAWEDDLLALLRSLGCPYKVTRSALKAPGTPHSWPPLLSVLYWLTLLCRATDGLAASPPPSTDLMTYITESYYLFLTGEDDAVASLDDDYHSKARAQVGALGVAIQDLEKEVQDLEAKRSKQLSAPSRLKALEEKKDAFTTDIQKFEAVVESWSTKIKEKEDALVEKEKELEAKVMNCQQTMAENEELLKQVETQVVNVRDVDRMAREMQAVEHDIAKLENANAVLEEKGWELEAALVSKLEEIEGLAELCNQSLRKLKPSIDFQYEVNAKGSSPAEILGTTYKTILKPALNALANETKRLVISKHDESIDLQKQLQGIVKMLEEKRSHVSVLQAKHNEMTAQLDSLDREIQSHVSRCAADARKLKDGLEKKEHHMSTVEKEAEEFLKNSEEGLQAALRETDEETQMCARELLKLIDSIAEYKEFVERSTAEMKKELYECVDDIASLSANIV